jgi:hypothetical protein
MRCLFLALQIRFLIRIPIIHCIWWNLIPLSMRECNSDKLFLNYLRGPNHAEGLVDPKVGYKNTVTGFRYPRACRFRIYPSTNSTNSTNFFQNVMWLKLATIDRFSNFFLAIFTFFRSGTHSRQF